METRSYLFGLYLMSAFFTSTSDANSAVIDGPIKSPINGHYYSILSNSDWTDAEAAAEMMGGHLATIRSAAEENWVQQTFAPYPFLWIGLYDPSHDSNGRPHSTNFVWVDGEPLTYTNWDTFTGHDEPNNHAGDEFWAQLVLTASSTADANTWNDIYNSADPSYPAVDPTAPPNFYGPDYGLVEAVPEPSWVPVLAAGGLARVLRR